MEDKNLTHKVIGCAMKVHTSLSFGYREVIYQRALAIEMEQNHLKFQKELQIPIHYENKIIGKHQLDFLVEGNLILELKAVPVLENSHFAQLMNYCQALNLPFGLLINFGTKSLQFKRIYNVRTLSSECKNQKILPES